MIFNMAGYVIQETAEPQTAAPDTWKWSRSDFFVFLPYFFFDTTKTPALA